MAGPAGNCKDGLYQGFTLPARWSAVATQLREQAVTGGQSHEPPVIYYLGFTITPGS